MSYRHLAPLISIEDLATSPPAKAGISSSILSTPTYCTSCKATIPQSSAYKWCFRCREKDRERQKRKKARRALVDAVRRGEVMGDISDHSGLPPKKKVKKGTERSVQAPKEKFTHILPLGHGPDVPIGDKVAAYVKARRADEGPSSTLGKRKARQADTFLVDIWTPFGCDEFQNSTELHGALAAKVKEYYKTHSARSFAPPRITFQGCYSVVMDPNVPHLRRIELESKLVRKISKMPHSYVFMPLFVHS
ncbi:hypothetical protein EIP86_007541 [Pleurotus ostreatoroseus]|nr:hypothetical protein EIP86_007541 [Pleurotus ostreatoroseus]